MLQQDFGSFCHIHAWKMFRCLFLCYEQFPDTKEYDVFFHTACIWTHHNLLTYVQVENNGNSFFTFIKSARAFTEYFLNCQWVCRWRMFVFCCGLVLPLPCGFVVSNPWARSSKTKNMTIIRNIKKVLNFIKKLRKLWLLKSLKPFNVHSNYAVTTIE